MEKVAIVGATGRIGSRILMELIDRNHVITAISRKAFDLPGSTLIIGCEGDVMDEKVLSGHVTALENEILISAIAPDPNNIEGFLEATENLIKTAEKAAVKKLITVGGAGSLLLPDGRKLMDQEDFKEEWKEVARIHERALAIYKSLENKKFHWIQVSPSALIEADEKIGQYRVGTEEKLIMDEEGISRISMEDFASFVVDLIEDDTYKNQRLTIGY